MYFHSLLFCEYIFLARVVVIGATLYLIRWMVKRYNIKEFRFLQNKYYSWFSWFGTVVVMTAYVCTYTEAWIWIILHTLLIILTIVLLILNGLPPSSSKAVHNDDDSRSEEP
jgi:hypothetical protein